MTLLLLAIFVIAEAAFAVFEFTAADRKGKWKLKRLSVNAIELVLFLIMLILPGIDLSFRFTGLVAMLLIRLVIAGIFYLAGRKNDKPKKRPAMIVGALAHIVLISVAMAPAFIFIDYGDRPVSGVFTPAETSAILTDTSRVEAFENDGSFREIPVHIFYPEETGSIQNGSLPLVFFSHGAFGWYQSNMSAYRELASNGYVVVSLDHPYHAFFTKDTTGKLITVDPEFMQNALYIGNEDIDATETVDIYSTEQEWIKLRTADMNYAIDAFKAACSGNYDGWTIPDGGSEKVSSALALIDTDRIGLMGHSLGGATAVTVGRRDDISAVIDIDGTMLGEQIGFEDGKYIINEEPYTTPLLCIDNDEHHDMSAELRETGYAYANNVVLDNAENAYRTYFKGAKHMDLTDLPLISPFIASMLGSGDIDVEYCSKTMNGIMVDFFDCYLKGEGTFSVNESY